MIKDTLFQKTLQLCGLAIRRKRHALERAMQFDWRAKASLQIDECLNLEELLGELSARAVAA
jgi:hypothetical protein